MEILLLGERFGADDALRLGLVNRVVPEAELDRVTAAVVAAIVSGPVAALRNGKRLIQQSLAQTLSALRGRSCQLPSQQLADDSSKAPRLLDKRHAALRRGRRKLMPAVDRAACRSSGPAARLCGSGRSSSGRRRGRYYATPDLTMTEARELDGRLLHPTSPSSRRIALPMHSGDQSGLGAHVAIALHDSSGLASAASGRACASISLARGARMRYSALRSASCRQ